MVSPATTPTASPPRRLAAADRRTALLTAAAPLFAERGYAGTRLDDIAAAASVTKPIVYRHFESKKDLYLALLARHERDMSGFTERGAVLHGYEPREQMLRAVLDEWLDYVRANSHGWLMIFRDSSGDEEIRARRIAVSARAREVIVLFIAAMAGEQLPRGQIQPTAVLLTSGLAGLALWWIDHPRVAKTLVLEAALRICAPAFG